MVKSLFLKRTLQAFAWAMEEGATQRTGKMGENQNPGPAGGAKWYQGSGEKWKVLFVL